MKNIIKLLVFCVLSSCSESTSTIKPFSAKKIEHELEIHKDRRIDNYFWMRLSDQQKEAEVSDAQTKDVLDYLSAENDYLKSIMKPTEALQDSLFKEMTGRIQQNDQSAPLLYQGYYYYTRYEEDNKYPFYCRKKGDVGSKEELMLDVSKMAKDCKYYSVGGKSVSSNNELLAFSVDTISRREYTIYIKNLKTGKILSDKIERTRSRIAWANDNKTFFYAKADSVTLRSYQIFRHTLGTEASEDVLIYEETDESFDCNVWKSKSGKFLFHDSYNVNSTEYRYLDTSTPYEDWKVFQPREHNLEYEVEHAGNHFYIRTNYLANNYRLMKSSTDLTSKEQWKEIIGNRKDILLEKIDVFKDYFVLTERKEGFSKLRVINSTNFSDYYIKFKDPVYTASTRGNIEYNTRKLRLSYSSLTTPSTLYEYDLLSKKQEILKQQKIVGSEFSSKNYTSERIYVPSRDGKRIPVSIVYKKGLNKNGTAPLLLYGYGAYGVNIKPRFSSARLSLLDRGFVYAIAHIRGSQTMGLEWYNDGKLLKKKNTFYDFIDCANYLISNKYTSANHLYAKGGSAGGLLMGAVMNMEPNLWNGIIATVPSVDVLSTGLDESIPLTIGEFDEWGNPKEKLYYDYIKSYSPYDNIEKKDYPNVLVTTGFWDGQVQYWEPAKWVAKLREYKTNDNLLIMNCNMTAGHQGDSGRFDGYKKIALQYAFLLHLEQIQ